MSTSASQRLRPFVPRIDPFAQSAPVTSGELTPASSHGSLVASPISTSSGRRSPFLKPPRKTSGPPIQRPPSPELISQDCAFPPFPMNRNRSKDVSPRESVRGRARTPELPRPFEQQAKRSASVGAMRPRRRQGTADSSAPSTTSSSRQASFSSRINSRQGSTEKVPPVPALQPSSSPHSSTSDLPVAKKEVDRTTIWPQFNDTDYPELSAPETFNKPLSQGPHETQEFPRLEPVARTDSNLDRNVQKSLFGTTTPREPSYRSKRPPPIMSVSSNFPQPSESPPEVPPTPATPSSSLARTLTGLFSRKRGKSVASKTNTVKPQAADGPRFIALSPDPDPQEVVQPTEPESQPGSPQMETHPPMPSLQAVTHASADVTPATHRFPEPSQAQISDSEDTDASSCYEEDQDASPMEQDVERSLAAVVPLVNVEKSRGEETENLNRASIDSASSYGSVGFSNSSESSRTTNTARLHSQVSSISTARTASSIGDSLMTRFQTFENVLIPPNENHEPQYGQQEFVAEPTPIEVQCNGKEKIPPMPSIPESPVKELMPSERQRMRRPSKLNSSRGTCRGCKQPILSGQRAVSSKDGRLSGKYHKACFVCETCRTAFATADFYVHNDHPYCAHHYHVLNQTLCEGCGKGIEGEFLETSTVSGQAAAKKFHPQCLRCATCKVQLHEDYFELGGRVYCERDAFRMVVPPKSPYDTAPSRPSPLNREYINSGEPPQGIAAGRFPERRLTKLMTTY